MRIDELFDSKIEWDEIYSNVRDAQAKFVIDENTYTVDISKKRSTIPRPKIAEVSFK